MASAKSCLFSSLRTRKLPLSDEFIAPSNVTGIVIIQLLAAVSSELIEAYSNRLFRFQRKNSRSLIRKIEVLVSLFEILRDSREDELCSTAVLCLKELYLVIYRCKMLLDYMSSSSRLLILLQNRTISGCFHDLNKEICNLLDVLLIPLRRSVYIEDDTMEQMELLKKQTSRAKFFVDEDDDALRRTLFRFLDESCHQVPDKDELELTFVERLGIRNEQDWIDEIEFLDEQLLNYSEEFEVASSVLDGLAALLLHCRFLFFGDHHLGFLRNDRDDPDAAPIPKDFCCPISLELMRDPVTISTGQTYDRDSILRWIDAGHSTCPKTGQSLDESHLLLLPNRVLRNLIFQYCTANAIPFDRSSESSGASACRECSFTAAATRAAVEINGATIRLLVGKLSSESNDSNVFAAREIRLLAKKGKENRAMIADAGAISHLKKYLRRTADPAAEENSVTAILNLSIYDRNKSVIMEEEGCLKGIVEVLRNGTTEESRENAAATLFSLSSVHDYKKRIAEEEGAMGGLVELLQKGTARGKKDAVTALFNLSTHSDNCGVMISSGAVRVLVRALAVEGVAEEAVAAVALIVRQTAGAESVGKEESAVVGLLRVMQRGSPKGKENAVAVLLELCRIGRADVRERIFGAPALESLLQTLVFTGTRRARRKAASLARFSRQVKI